MKIRILLVTLFLVGCTQSNLSKATAPVNLTPAQIVATSEKTSSDSAKPATPPASTPAASTPQRTPTRIPGFTLQIISPEDESIVNTAKIVISGKTSLGIVVSVNGNLADVDSLGKFQYVLMLEEGPNIIQVVASDINGDELSNILRIIYEP